MRSREGRHTAGLVRFLVAAMLMVLIAGPAVGADHDAERIVTRQVASIVPPAGGVAVSAGY
jgi:hypothetical protein